MSAFICVGAGGALGAVLRYAVSLLPYKGTFPVLTLVTNVIGALAIGIIAGTAVKRGMPQNLVLFLKTGVCGGFTTFSTFSLESQSLLEKGHYAAAVLYMGMSLAFCLIGVMMGLYLAKRM